jgi:RNA polymerase sigma-70 factor (sigma-E family)
MTTGRHEAGSSGEDELLSRLYPQVTEWQAAQFAPGYDVAGGLDRYRAWLGEHTVEEHSKPRPVQLKVATALRAGLAAFDANTAAQGTGEPAGASQAWQGSADPDPGAGTLAAGAAAWPLTALYRTPVAGADWDATQAVTELYTTHYRSLVRLAVLLVRDVATAEEIVQDSFIAMHGAWRRLRDSEKALSYLRQSVVNRSRVVLRHRVTEGNTAPQRAPDMPAAEQGALSLLERSAVIKALRALPRRQREALVLKYYADLSEAQIAAAMGISTGAVKSHTARGMASLRAALGVAQ